MVNYITLIFFSLYRYLDLVCDLFVLTMVLLLFAFWKETAYIYADKYYLQNLLDTYKDSYWEIDPHNEEYKFSENPPSVTIL